MAIVANASTASFADVLRLTMAERRLSIAAVSEATEIHPRLIAKYRAGGCEPRDYFGDPTPNALKIADALSLPIDELLPPTEQAA